MTPTTTPRPAPRTPARPERTRPAGAADWVVFAVLVVDAILLAVLELLYLPLRLDGRVLPELGSAPLPLSVLVAIVTTPLLVAAAMHVAGKRLAAVLLVCWLLVLMVVGLAGPGGDLILIDDWRALLLLAGGALPGMLVLMGLDLRPRRRTT